MAALSANLTSITKANQVEIATVIKSAAVMFGNAYTALEPATGRIKPWGAAVSGDIPLGLAQATGTGVAGTSVVGATDIGGGIIKCTVTGTSAITDQGKDVFLGGTDNINDLTLTRPTTNILPVGWISRWYTGTTCDVVLYSASELRILALCGASNMSWCLGSIAPVGGTGDMLTGIVAPFHAKFLAVYAICLRKPTDVDVDYSVNLEIGGTNVTGGVVTLLFSDAVAAKKSGTAITAANEFHMGDLIDVEAVANVAGTATDVGTYNLYADVQLLPGV